RTVAGGIILEPQTQRLKRNKAEILERLVDLRDLSAPSMIAVEIERQAQAGMTLSRLSQLAPLAEPRIVEIVQKLPVIVTQSGSVLRKADLDDLSARIPALLEREGLSHDALAAALPGVGAALLDEALARLQARGAIAKRG